MLSTLVEYLCDTAVPHLLLQITLKDTGHHYRHSPWLRVKHSSPFLYFERLPIELQSLFCSIEVIVAMSSTKLIDVNNKKDTACFFYLLGF